MSLLIFQHSESTGALRLGEALCNFGHRLRVVNLHRDVAIPVDLEDVDGVISMGGPQRLSIGSLEWLDAEMDLLRLAEEAGLPVLGICLGSQILARAMGGTIGPNEGGIDLCWDEVQLNQFGREDPLHAGIAWRSMQFHWHRDAVVDLPPDARVLSSSKQCPIQSWARGLHTYGFQYHPEIEPSSIDQWIDESPEALVEAGTNREQLSEQTLRNYPAMSRLADRLFMQMALLLMPVDRRYQGQLKDVHH